MGIPMIQVDAFASEPFRGNPAMVCLLECKKPNEWLQNVAMEMNLSETAFLQKQPNGYQLRWFTPKTEVDLCGHATLASAHVLWQEGLLGAHETARFHTRSGLLTASRQGEWIELDFPATVGEQCDAPAGLAEALGVKPVAVRRNRFDYLVEIGSDEELRALRPRFDLLAEVQARGVIVTCRSSTPEYDFTSRFFAPRSGVNEDPVTGSAHCALAPYWSAILGKTEMVGFQASSRGGVVKVRLKDDRVLLSGKAVTVLRGELLV